MASSLSEELIAIRMELKGQREAISGLKAVDKAQKGIGTSTTAAGVAAEKAEKKTSRLSRAYASLGKAAKWGFGILGVAGVLALHTAIDNTEELSKTTVGLTRNFDLQNNVASRWAAVARARDIDSKALSMSFATLSSRMVEAGRKGGTALTPFHQLGLTQEEVAKGAHNFEWGLLRVADALGDAEGGAKRTTAAKALLGKGFQTLLPLFSEGTKGLKEQLHWADKYGVTLDGKTNNAIMDMVTAQRESKVATLGLQLALTKALMPAIEGGQEQLHRFIQTLNDPDLTADQKIHRIEQQFLGIEDTLVQIISDALPRVAEHGGELGLELAGAVWHGFENSDLGGKLVITAWLLNFMGGGGLIRKTAGRAGGMMAWGLLKTLMPTLAAELAVSGSVGSLMMTKWKNLGKWSSRMFTVGWGVGLALLVPWIAEEIENHLPQGTKEAIGRWGRNAGNTFVNCLIDRINWGIRRINDVFDKANVFSFLGVDAPNIGEVGHADLRNAQEKVAEGAHITHPFPKPGQVPPGSEGPGITTPLPKGGRRRGARVETPRLPRINFSSWSSGRPSVSHIHLHIDGKEIAEVVAHHVASAEALA